MSARLARSSTGGAVRWTRIVPSAWTPAMEFLEARGVTRTASAEPFCPCLISYFLAIVGASARREKPVEDSPRQFQQQDQHERAEV